MKTSNYLFALAGLLITAVAAEAAQKYRFATYNTSMNRGAAGQLLADLAAGNNEQISKIAQGIGHNKPDVILINEFDYDETGASLDLFRNNYLAKTSYGYYNASHRYPYAYAGPSNTGVDSGVDLDGDGELGGLNDGFGFGFFPGQFGLAVFSKYPIDYANIRTFQTFLWKDYAGQSDADRLLQRRCARGVSFVIQDPHGCAYHDPWKSRTFPGSTPNTSGLR